MKEDSLMPMIDIYASKGTFKNKNKLAQEAAVLVKSVEGVPDIPMFRQNTVGFIHEVDTISNIDGENDYIRVQILTNSGALTREQQIEVTKKMTELIAKATGDSKRIDKIAVLLTEAVSGGWGIWGHAYENEELVEAAKIELSLMNQK